MHWFCQGKRCLNCLEHPEYNYLLTIPGFGPDVFSKVLGAIGNPFRFDNGKQVLKLADYDLSANRSERPLTVLCRLFPKEKKPICDMPFISLPS